MHAPKKVMLAALIAAGVAVAPSLAQAQQKFPTKPVRIVVPTSAGGQNDTMARMIGLKMSESWKQPVVVENRPGASGTLGAAMAAKAAPDGYTLLFPGVTIATSAALQRNLPYDPLKDFTGVTQIGLNTYTLVVAPALGVKSVNELVALAQARPGKILYGSPGAGSFQHLMGERFRLAAGFNAVHVAFTGGPQTAIETLAGRIQYSNVGLGVSLPFITDGKLLALAVYLPQRSLHLPDVPVMAETLPDFKRPDGSYGLLAPARTPRPILNQISKEVARIFALPDVKVRMHAISFVPAPSTPEEYDKILRAEIDTLSKVVRDAGLRST